MYQRHKPPQEIGANGAPKAFVARVISPFGDLLIGKKFMCTFPVGGYFSIPSLIWIPTDRFITLRMVRDLG